MSAALVSAFHHNLQDMYKQGLQSQRNVSDLRQQLSLMSPYTASSYINIPVANQGSSAFQGLKSQTKQPLTASNSVSDCSAACHLKSIASRDHKKLDRSISEPVERSQRLAPPNSSRYKTELCRPYEENGTCKYGDKCQFAHGIQELRNLTRHPKYKTELCRTFHSSGFCPYGPRCHFIHNSEDAKQCLFNTLQTNNNGCTMLKDHFFNLGSAGDLSPTSSTSSSGSPTSSSGSFFIDDNHPSYSPPVPQSAAPVLNNFFLFNDEFGVGSKSMSVHPLAASQEFNSSPPGLVCDNFTASANVVASEIENLKCFAQNNAESPNFGAADVDRNLIRLPIFSRLAHANTP